LVQPPKRIRQTISDREDDSLLKPRTALILAFALLFPAAAPGFGASAADPPKIRKPRPAPEIPSTVPPLPPAYFDPTLAVGGEKVKARKVDTRLTVEVEINGQGPYRFVVDSGADTSAVGLQIAHNLQLPLATPVILNGMTARNIVDRVKVDSLTLGPTTVNDLKLPALREVDLGGDGLIGIDALHRQRLMMDFDKHLITVEDASTPVRSHPGDIVIVAKRKRGQLILTHVKAAGLDLDAVIDTGSEISIGNLALRDQLLRHNRDKFVTITAIGVTGEEAKLNLAKIGELELGPITLHDVPMAFADVPPFKIFGLSDQPALLLGTDILENFRRVSLDFRARKVRFQLKRCEDAVIISTSPSASAFTRMTSMAGSAVCGSY
jgi:predicted aspartyl protease